jgi:hypothetical protein
MKDKEQEVGKLIILIVIAHFKRVREEVKQLYNKGVISIINCMGEKQKEYIWKRISIYKNKEVWSQLKEESDQCLQNHPYQNNKKN